MTKTKILRKIHENGLKALKLAIELSIKNPNRPADTGIFDCFVGNTLTAYVLAKAKMPKEVRAWIKNVHKPNENWHCKYAIEHNCPRMPAEIAKKVQEFHKKVVDELGWVGYMVCMPLTGERMAMGTAFALKPITSAHSTPQGFIEEFDHASYPLLLLQKYASEEKLKKALKKQEEFINMVYAKNIK